LVPDEPVSPLGPCICPISTQPAPLADGEVGLYIHK